MLNVTHRSRSFQITNHHSRMPLRVFLHQLSGILLFSSMPELLSSFSCKFSSFSPFQNSIEWELDQPWFTGQSDGQHRVEVAIEDAKVDLWRRPQSARVRRVKALVVDDLRRRSRPNLMWERLNHGMKELQFSCSRT
ncbi:hypothetical protein Tco_0548245 [Tanacetum coccineum]